MRILIIEDDPKTAGYLKQGLSENGYAVDAALTGSDGLALAHSKEYVLMILDVMIPKMDGWSILAELRREGNKTPVLFLTARDSVEDRVRGLKLGADDYLVKPFSFSELLARMESILRRGNFSQPLQKIQVGDLEIDFTNHRVTRAAKRIELTQKEFLLLYLLARHPGRALSRTLIAEQVWDMNFDSDTNVVDVAIRRLRAKVDEPFQRTLIHTVRGMGYALEAR